MASSTKAIFVLITEPNVFSFATNVTKDPISGGRSANFQKQAILNRSSSYVTFSNGENPTLDVAIELYAIQTAADEQKIIQAMTSLRQLLLPVESGVQPPPLCKITLGAGYNGMYDNWPCVLVNVGETFEVDAGFSTNLQSRVIAVKLSFVGVELNSVDCKASGNYTDPDWSNVAPALQAPTVTSFTPNLTPSTLVTGEGTELPIA